MVGLGLGVWALGEIKREQQDMMVDTYLQVVSRIHAPHITDLHFLYMGHGDSELAADAGGHHIKVSSPTSSSSTGGGTYCSSGS